ncbi:methyltransferase domain-containing protein [Streptomyces sp. E11-3]|uniref:methyltransferase domain-containing protein n=1 Tax=Streptomyces sp. E11-3 TaxID=3110112 RepID=UPI00397F9241
MTAVDTEALEVKVKELYRHVAEEPQRPYHFEMGRELADRLGYPADLLDQVPAEAVESFAGVGYFFGLAALRPGEHVIDLGSGSGMDAFCAALQVGPTGGRVVGVDFTLEQLGKARRLAGQLAGQLGLSPGPGTGTGPSPNPGPAIEFVEGRIENLPVADESFDCAISNGVINLSPRKQRVFTEAARVLRPGGRLAIADIVTEQQLTDAITADADLWASCIGGAAQQDTYRHMIEAAGLKILQIRENPYTFLSSRAVGASARYGVKSISLLAAKPGTGPGPGPRPR